MEEKYYKWVKASKELPEYCKDVVIMRKDKLHIGCLYDERKVGEPNAKNAFDLSELTFMIFEDRFSEIEWLKELSPASITDNEILKMGDKALTELKKNPASITHLLNKDEGVSYNTGFHKGFDLGYKAGIKNLLPLFPASEQDKKIKRQLSEAHLVLYRVIHSLEFINLTPRQAKFYQQAETVLKDSYDINDILRQQDSPNNIPVQSNEQPQPSINEAAEKIPELLGWTNDGTSEGNDMKLAFKMGAEWQSKQQIKEK